MSEADRLFNQALSALEANLHELAIERLTASLRQRPADREAALMLAQTLRAVGRVAEAEACLREILGPEPGSGADLPLLLELADLRLSRKDAEGAARACFRALVLKPDHSEALYLLGNAFFDARAFDESARTYERALASSPFDAEIWHNYGAALEKLGREEEAQSAFDKYHRLSTPAGRGPPPDFSQVLLEEDED